MNWPVIFIVGLLVASASGFFFGKDYEHKATLADIAKQQSDHMDALNLVAVELAKIKVVQKTNNITLEREIVEKRIYQDCKNTPEAVKAINSALVPAK